MSVLVGQKAPDFTAQAVCNGTDFVSQFSLSDFKLKKYVVLFFYPKDFTFVCPTELHAFQEKLAEFEKRNTQVIAISTDTEQSHWGWLQVPKEKGGIRGITYPLVADTNKTISQDYDVLVGKIDYDEENERDVVNGELIAYRALFLIDKDGIVRHQLVNDLSLGRDVDETLRILDALQFTEQHGETCPANWNKSADGLKPSHQATADYLAKH